ncbi:MAG: hypothetical protein AB2A00_32120 [Myxococcota bacterium]
MVRTLQRNIPGNVAPLLAVTISLVGCPTTSPGPDACVCFINRPDAGALDGSTEDGSVPDAGGTDAAFPTDAAQPTDAGTLDAGGADAATPSGDNDGDGVDDGFEAQLAHDYFPFFSLHPDDECTTHGVLFRVAPHPDDTARIMIWFDVLYDRDCGASSHEGDNEAFGVVVDPGVPAPTGILAVRSISHQGTVCQVVTDCGPCAPGGACTTACRNGALYPVVFASVNKHGGYVKEQRCDQNLICDFGGCGLNTTPTNPPMVNAGEPGRPLVNNLTTQGFINAEHGWTSQTLMNYDPWGGAEFGGAGNVAEDLVDTAFVINTQGCNVENTEPACNP